MEHDVLLHKQEGAVCWLTMNRPKAMNSLSFDLVAALQSKLADIKNDDNVRVVVIQGTSGSFCAGADLKTMLNDYAPGELDILDRIVEFFDVLRHYPKPVIAGVNGIALAGGMELMMCCDLVYATDTAKIGDAHANYGIVPGGGGAAIMPRLLPLPIAKYLMFTGEFVPASMLAHYGLINEVVSEDALHSTITRVANIIAEKSPIGIARTKRVANEALDKSAEDSLRDERLASRDQFRSYDYNEGIHAFLEKRKPEFKGY